MRKASCLACSFSCSVPPNGSFSRDRSFPDYRSVYHGHDVSTHGLDLSHQIFHLNLCPLIRWLPLSFYLCPTGTSIFLFYCSTFWQSKQSVKAILKAIEDWFYSVLKVDTSVVLQTGLCILTLGVVAASVILQTVGVSILSHSSVLT